MVHGVNWPLCQGEKTFKMIHDITIDHSTHITYWWSKYNVNICIQGCPNYIFELKISITSKCLLFQIMGLKDNAVDLRQGHFWHDQPIMKFVAQICYFLLGEAECEPLSHFGVHPTSLCAIIPIWLNSKESWRLSNLSVNLDKTPLPSIKDGVGKRIPLIQLLIMNDSLSFVGGEFFLQDFVASTKYTKLSY